MTIRYMLAVWPHQSIDLLEALLIPAKMRIWQRKTTGPCWSSLTAGSWTENDEMESDKKCQLKMLLLAVIVVASLPFHTTIMKDHIYTRLHRKRTIVVVFVGHFCFAPPLFSSADCSTILMDDLLRLFYRSFISCAKETVFGKRREDRSTASNVSLLRFFKVFNPILVRIPPSFSFSISCWGKRVSKSSSV